MYSHCHRKKFVYIFIYPILWTKGLKKLFILSDGSWCSDMQIEQFAEFECTVPQEVHSDFEKDPHPA